MKAAGVEGRKKVSGFRVVDVGLLDAFLQNRAACSQCAEDGVARIINEFEEYVDSRWELGRSVSSY